MTLRFIHTVFVVAIVLLFVDTSSLYAYRNDLRDASIGVGLSIKDMRFELGQLAGRLCNDTGEILDEISFLFRAYDHSKNIIKQQTIDVQGINDNECRGFHEEEKFKEYMAVKSWDAVPVYFNRVPISSYTNKNKDIFVDNVKIRNSQVVGEVCNSGKNDLNDMFMGVFGTKFKDKLAFKSRGYVGDLASGTCADFTIQHNARNSVDARQPVLFSFFEIASKGKNGNGEIVDGLIYENLQYKRKRLSVTLVNTSRKSQSNIYIKFYGMRFGNSAIVSKSFYINKLGPGEKFSIRKKLYKEKKVNHWRFSVIGWE